jgi:hypothetical protein
MEAGVFVGWLYLSSDEIEVARRLDIKLRWIKERIKLGIKERVYAGIRIRIG